MFNFKNIFELDYNKIDKSELALILLETLFLGSNKKIDKTYEPYVKDFLKKHTERTEQLHAIAELCTPYETSKQLYVACTAYIWVGATGRKKLIELLPIYIEKGAQWSGSYGGYVEHQFRYRVKRQVMELANYYHYLGKAYEGEYMLDDAVISYQKSIDTLPLCGTYTDLAGVLTKLGRFDEAIEALEAYKASKYYDPETAAHISKKMDDIKKKQSRGYVYRPRPQK